MADSPISIAIPVRNGGALFGEVLRAIRDQRVEREIELVVADSNSADGSAELAREFGATVFAVDRFSHGETRNELMRRSHGSQVAFLTQDAVPADDRWLERLLRGFELAPDVALVCGPYRARRGAPVAVERELRSWFGALSPDGTPRVDRGVAPAGPGPVTFFTDANGAVSRAAWSRVPFRAVPYGEDQALALDMMRAGYAKAFMPEAVVIHSHVYGVADQFRRSFDEWWALREIHGFVPSLAPVSTILSIQSAVRADIRASRGLPAPARARESVRSLRHWTVRAAGAAAGARADRLPPAVRAWCSLEGRQELATDASSR